jgi:hypothetical protein
MIHKANNPTDKAIELLTFIRRNVIPNPIKAQTPSSHVSQVAENGELKPAIHRIVRPIAQIRDKVLFMVKYLRDGSQKNPCIL